MATATFHPQAWINDYAIDVDAEGETTWMVDDSALALTADSYESDELRFADNAPQWVKDWSGPFYVSVS
jgi:hypothetical protein